MLNHLVSSEQGKAVAKRRKDLETARAFDDRTYLDMCDCVASNLLFYCSKFQNDLSLCLARYSPIHVTKGEQAVWPLFFFFPLAQTILGAQVYAIGRQWRRWWRKQAYFTYNISTFVCVSISAFRLCRGTAQGEKRESWCLLFCHVHVLTMLLITINSTGNHSFTETRPHLTLCFDYSGVAPLQWDAVAGKHPRCFGLRVLQLRLVDRV